MNNKKFQKKINNSIIKKIINNTPNFLLKTAPILISLLALFFSYKSYSDKLFSEPLAYHITTEKNVNNTKDATEDNIATEGQTMPVIKRSSGFIKNTTGIVYFQGKYIRVVKFPTMDFSKHFNVLQKIFLNDTSTSVGIKNLEYPLSQGNIKKYTYFFLLIEGMDGSKNLHMITYYYNKEEGKVLSKNYDEMEILDPESSEDYTDFFLVAKKDFFSLKKDLKENNLL
ncbi:hypothetical protein [Lactococcus garvieae]|uniref:hypothetical protein n=1 Tax=Lactococcus garvieae TaxID=1363 RepID=UPI00398F8AF1